MNRERKIVNDLYSSPSAANSKFLGQVRRAARAVQISYARTWNIVGVSRVDRNREEKICL